MGNTNSNAHVSLAVQTDKMIYMAGETVKGSVYVMVTAETEATGVFLRVKGLERVNFTERRTGRDAEDLDRTLSDEVSFFNVTMPLLTAQAGSLQPGQYQIPFIFSLPASLPGTYPEEEGMRGGETYRCSIDYEVLAYVEVPGVFTNNIRHRQLLAVTANFDPKAIHAETVVKNKKVCFVCCIPRGEIWMRASMDKSHYMPGETAMIVVEMNNGSRATIRHVSMRLVRQLRLGTRSQGWLFYQSDVLTSLELPGLLPGQSFMDATGRTVPFLLSSTKDGKPLPAEVKGSIVECTYAVKIFVKIDWTPSIGIEVPIHIYHSPDLFPSSSLPEAYHREPLALPPTASAVEWNPTIEQEVDIPMASAVAMEMNGKGGAPGVESPIGGVMPSAPSMRWFGRGREL